MKYIILLITLITALPALAQRPAHTPHPKARQIMDSASARYNRSGGDAAAVKKIIPQVDQAIKTDSLWYDAWLNKLNLQCQLSQFDKGLATLQQMKSIFPTEGEVQFLLGILQYKTGHATEALATFNKLLAQYNADLAKNPNPANTKNITISKGVVMILADKKNEGKRLLLKIHDEEKDPYMKSYLAFYINSTKQQIIDDRTPGR